MRLVRSAEVTAEEIGDRARRVNRENKAVGETTGHRADRTSQLPPSPNISHPEV